jgi:hypothetical protein
LEHIVQDNRLTTFELLKQAREELGFRLALLVIAKELIAKLQLDL